MMIGAGAALGGLPAMRPDQQTDVPPSGIVPGQRTQLRAKQVILTGNLGSALLAYASGIAAGGLVDSIAPVSFNDSKGNLVLAGIVNYQQLGSPKVAVQLFQDAINFYTAATEAGPWALQGDIRYAPGGNQLLFETFPGGVIFSTLVNTNNGLVVVGGLATDTLSASGLATLAGGLAVTGGETADSVAVSGSAAGGLLLTVANAVSPSAANVRVTSAASGDPAIGIRVAGDTANRLLLDNSPGTGGGRIRAGQGTGLNVSFFQVASGEWASDYIAYNNAGAGEAWNAVTFQNGWTNAAAGPNMAYRRVAAPFSSIQVIGKVVIPVGFAGGQQVANALPAAYRPNSVQTLPGWDLTVNVPVRFQLATGGAISWQGTGVGAPAAGDTVEIFPDPKSLDA